MQAASTLFNSLIFIFSTQPYSIGKADIFGVSGPCMLTTYASLGDLVFIDGDPLVVKEFGLMATTFERVDGQWMLIPNSILSASKHILNVRRSGALWETTNVSDAGVGQSVSTTADVLHLTRRLRYRLTRRLKSCLTCDNACETTLTITTESGEAAST